MDDKHRRPLGKGLAFINESDETQQEARFTVNDSNAFHLSLDNCLSVSSVGPNVVAALFQTIQNSTEIK